MGGFVVFNVVAAHVGRGAPSTVIAVGVICPLRSPAPLFALRVFRLQD